MSQVFTDQNFETDVLKSPIPVLVDFWAVWCGPCQMAGPVIDELAEEYKDKVLVGKFGVMSIPTVIVFLDGKEDKREVGFFGKEGYKKLLDEVL
jgi:thioredoxin 1